MDVNEIIAFWDSVDVDFRAVEKIYVAITMGGKKEDYNLKGDLSKVWDFIAADIKANPAPEGSTYEIPSFN